ncbi:MAG: type IV pilus assembly protein PilM [bacterium]|nr:type IV pilus assembly protein PilM [bacterium]
MAFDFLKSFRSFGSITGKSRLGLDIGTSSIKIVELEKKGGRFELINYGSFELLGSSSLVQQNKSNQSILKLPDQEITIGIQELIKKANFKSVDVVASIPSFSTFATVIEMPYISNEDLARALPFEAKKYIPIPLNEVVLDWSIVGVVDNQSSVQSKPSNVEIFLAAVPKDETARYRNIIKNAGLKLKAIELENSALIRALLGNDLSPTAIVNIGGRSTSIIIVNRGYERVSHNYEVGGFEITKSIAQSLSVSLEKAEELKKKFGLTKGTDNIISDSMISLMNMIVFEAQKTISNYEETKNEKIANIVLVGGLANMPGFVEYFKDKLGRTVVFGNSFSRLIHQPELHPITPELNNVFSVAIGLAMREIK